MNNTWRFLPHLSLIFELKHCYILVLTHLKCLQHPCTLVEFLEVVVCITTAFSCFFVYIFCVNIERTIPYSISHFFLLKIFVLHGTHYSKVCKVNYCRFCDMVEGWPENISIIFQEFCAVWIYKSGSKIVSGSVLLLPLLNLTVVACFVPSFVLRIPEFKPPQS